MDLRNKPAGLTILITIAGTCPGGSRQPVLVDGHANFDSAPYTAFIVCTLKASAVAGQRKTLINLLTRLSQEEEAHDDEDERGSSIWVVPAYAGLVGKSCLIKHQHA